MTEFLHDEKKKTIYITVERASERDREQEIEMHTLAEQKSV